MRPVRPSEQRATAAAKEAERLEKEETIRLVLELSPATRRNLKVRAAQEGLTVKSYIVGLLTRDGVRCVE